MEHPELTNELEVMAAIGRALGTLPDDDARQRVLRWACERFGIDSIPESTLFPDGVVSRAVSAANDPALKLDSIDDMFEAAPTAEDDLALPPTLPAKDDTSKQPVEAVLRSFVAEFQRFAEEWSGATA